MASTSISFCFKSDMYIHPLATGTTVLLEVSLGRVAKDARPVPLRAVRTGFDPSSQDIADASPPLAILALGTAQVGIVRCKHLYSPKVMVVVVVYR
jgi:hypothetical protein